MTIARGLMVFSTAACLLGAQAFAQDMPAEATEGDSSAGVTWPLGSEGRVKFFVDAASFRGTEGYTLQEFHILLDAKQLQFVPESGKYVAQLDVKIAITDDQGAPVASETWTRDLSVDNLRELKASGGPVRDLMGFSLKPGGYAVACDLEDMYGDRIGRVEGRIEVPDYESPGLASSDPVFSSGVVKEAAAGRFSRNGWVVRPKTTRVYPIGSAVTVYHELYHLSSETDAAKGTFDVRYVLTDPNGYPVSKPVDRRYRKAGESAVLVDSIQTEDLRSGKYLLQITALDRGSRSHTVTTAPFYLTSEEPGATAGEDVSEGEIANLRYYRDIRYVAAERDLKIFGNLKGQDARDKFLKVFWQKLDPTPETAINERLIEHIRRMRFSENNFSGGHGQTGVDSDKGRVYIQYGPPSDKEYRSAADSPKPYEIWTYEGRGTYEFVFRDRRGIGVYELVHSTYPGELYNPNWQNEI